MWWLTRKNVTLSTQESCVRLNRLNFFLLFFDKDRFLYQGNESHAMLVNHFVLDKHANKKWATPSSQLFIQTIEQQIVDSLEKELRIQELDLSFIPTIQFFHLIKLFFIIFKSGFKVQYPERIFFYFFFPKFSTPLISLHFQFF